MILPIYKSIQNFFFFFIQNLLEVLMKLRITRMKITICSFFFLLIFGMMKHHPKAGTKIEHNTTMLQEART